MAEGEKTSAEGRGATLGEAKWAAIKELESRFHGVTAEHVEFDVLQEPGDDGTEAVVKVELDADRWQQQKQFTVIPEDAPDMVREALLRIVHELGMRVTVSVEQQDGTLMVDVHGDDLGLLIGKRGRTIDALQQLLSQLASRAAGEYVRVGLDAAGYRQRRKHIVERQAERAAREAVRFGREVELSPMGPTERKQVHIFLEQRQDVATHSEGSEPNRCVVVSPLEERVVQ